MPRSAVYGSGRRDRDQSASFATFDKVARASLERQKGSGQIDVEDLVHSIEKLISGGSLSKISTQGTSDVAKKRKRVLIVDDSLTVRELERKLLTSHGYEVEAALDGMDGWNAVRTGHFDLIISDVVMPKMNGREFANQVLKLCPNAKMLFVSGYAADIVLQAGIPSNGVPFLQKPYSLKQLGGKVNVLLSVLAK